MKNFSSRLIIMLILSVLFSMFINGESGKTVLPGDVNDDGQIDGRDVTRLMKYTSDWDVLINGLNSDVNGDGYIDMRDITLILKYIAEWDVDFSEKKEYSIDFSLHPEVKEETIVNYTKTDAEYEDTSVKMWFDHITEKYVQKNTSPGNRDTYVMRMAKNEIQSCQFFLLPENTTSFKIELSDFENSRGEKIDTSLLYEYYALLNFKGEKIYSPDALPALLDKISVKANNTQGFVIKAKTEQDTSPGLYEATLNVYDSTTNKQIKTAKVYTYVWDFALPEETSLHTAVGVFDWRLINAYASYGMNECSTNELYKLAYDFLLENRICAYQLPYDFHTDKVTEYLDNPRVNTFCVNLSARTLYSDGEAIGKDLSTAYPLLSQKQEWLDKAYFYYTDEPTSIYGVNDLADNYNETIEIYENPNFISPFFTNFKYGNTDQISLMSQYINMWCVKINAFTPRSRNNVKGVSYIQDLSTDKKYGTFAERMDKEIADGDELWTYFCWEPTKPYANWLATCDYTEMQISIWQTYQVHATGVLYFSANEWNTYVYKDLGTTQTMGSPKAQGDGILFYPGCINDSYSPISSLRLEIVRDGIEDYEYLSMLEDIIGRNEVMKIVELVTEDVVTYTSNDDYLAAVRVILGNTLEKALKESN